MLKRILYGSGAVSVLTASYLLGSVTLGGAFAQTATPTTTPSAQATPGANGQSERNEPAGVTVQAETAALAAQAKITADQANAAALAGFAGGTVNRTELDSQSGTVVYDVQLTDSAGTRHEVQVDAASGKVLQTHTEAPEAPETPGAPETAETGN